VRAEHWWFTLPLRLRSIFRRHRVEQELDEELRFHLERRIEEGVASGLPPEEARWRALRAMGGLDQRKEEMRDARGVHWLTDLVDDLRYAVRILGRAPALTAFVVLTIALGIGMAAGTFSMVDALIFRPYPVPHPGRIVTVSGTTRDSRFEPFSYREYLDLRGRTRSYDGVVANLDMQAVAFAAEPGATPRVRGGLLVSGNYFRALGVEPRIGRGFREDEDQVPGRDAVVVLGAAFWRREFAGDPSVVGRAVVLNGRRFTVVGVAPGTFPGMGTFSHPDFYVPLAMAPVFSTSLQKSFFEDRDDRELTVRARLKPRARVADARGELAVLAKQFQAEYPDASRGRGAAVYTQFESRTVEDDNWKFGVVFAILALAVLLVACTNVAGLLLSRARSRTREIAVRLAIGAGRGRIVRLLLAESLVLAALGGIVGVAIGYGFVEWFQSKQTIVFQTDLPMSVPMRMDTRVLVATLALAGLSAVLCGLAPALQSTRTDLVKGLKSADADVLGRKRLWGRNVLVVAQVAVSLMLLTASFLMARSFERSMLEGTGFAKDHLLMVRFDPRLVRYGAAQTKRFYERLLSGVRDTMGVERATLTQNVPYGQEGFDGLTFAPEGFEMPRDRESFASMAGTVDTDYFETMGVPILRGRAFRTSDREDSPRVAVVNEAFAKHYWPNADPVGQRIRLGGARGAPVEIVGVARTIKYQSGSDLHTDFLYMPLSQHPVAGMTLLARSSGNPLDLVPAVRNVVRRLDANLPMMQTRAYEDLYLNQAVYGPRIAIDLVGMMGGVGLALAIAGLYGLVAYNVSRRTREIGIRFALGAKKSDVLRLVMGKGLTLVSIGTVFGIAMGFAVERLMNAMLFNAGGVDVLVYLVVVPAMICVTMVAAYVPARRAARIEPTLALRYE
jgi:macrolide transport system ATP-binding/permease protein